MVLWKIRGTKGGIWKFIFHRRRKRASINLPRALVRIPRKWSRKRLTGCWNMKPVLLRPWRKAARRGDLLDHDEVVERIEQLFRS